MQRKKTLSSIFVLGGLAIAMVGSYCYTYAPKLTPKEREIAQIALATVQDSTFRVASVVKKDKEYRVFLREPATLFGGTIRGGHCTVVVGEDGVVERVIGGA